MVYELAAFDWGRMLYDRRGEELDDIVAAARRMMKETMNEGPA